MKLQIGKTTEKQTQVVEEQPKKVGLSIAKKEPVPEKPKISLDKKPVAPTTTTLNERFEETKKTQSRLNALVNKPTDKVQKEPAKTLANVLNKPNVVEISPKTEVSKASGLKIQAKETHVDVQSENIPRMAPIGEKFVLTAEATTVLPEEVLLGFETRMQNLLSLLGTQQLSTAFHAILKYTKEHPELKDILRPSDVNLFVKACRQSYGLVVKAKNANATKKAQKNANVQDIIDDLADVTFEI